MIRTIISPNEIMDRAALAEALGITGRTITREISLGRLKAHRRSRTTYFLGEEVLEWIRSGEFRPMDEEDGED